MNFQRLYDLASDAGYEAGFNHTPEPVSWTQGDVFGKPVEGAKVWNCSEGLCGFAWIALYNKVPAGMKRKVKTPFAHWLIANGHARWDSYGKYTHISVSEFNQSVDRKYAYAQAFVRVLENHGIEAFAKERLD